MYINKETLELIYDEDFTRLETDEEKELFAVLEYDPVPELVRLQYIITGEIRVEGGHYIQGWIISEPSPQEYLNNATAQLNTLTRQANAQVTALSGRITTLNWLIDEQDPEDEDYMEPTAEDEAERTALKALLVKWNSYNAKLGKVKNQTTWPMEPVWPVMPTPYTNEMSSRVAILPSV